MWGLLPTPASQSPTPAGRPTSQLSSDTIPQVKDSVPQDCHLLPPTPTSDSNHKPRLLTCASGQLAINQRFPRPPSSGWINLLEQLTELRKTFCLPDHWFITGYNSGTARWKKHRHRARCGERAQSFHALSRKCSSPQSPRVHQPRRLTID